MTLPATTLPCNTAAVETLRDQPALRASLITHPLMTLPATTPPCNTAAVETLRDQPALRASLGRAGRETVLQYFTVDRQMKQYAALYKDLMATKLKLPGFPSSNSDSDRSGSGTGRRGEAESMPREL